MRGKVLCWLLALSHLLADNTLVPAADSSTLVGRRRYLESIPAAKKDELRRKQERFEKLSAAEREKLRQLEQRLAEDPHGERLREVMLRYHEWLSTLQSSQRTEILSAPAEERIERIKKRLDEQEKRRRDDLARQKINPQDIGVIRSWMRTIFLRAEPKLLATLTPDEREEYQGMEEFRRVPRVIGAVMRKQRMENPPLQLDVLMGITEEDRQSLVKQLSANAQQAYQAASNENDRRQLVQSWMRVAFFREIIWVSPQEVKQSKLPNHLRDQIDYLAPHQVRAELEGFFRGGEDGRKRFGEGMRPPYKANPPPPRD